LNVGTEQIANFLGQNRRAGAKGIKRLNFIDGIGAGEAGEQMFLGPLRQQGQQHLVAHVVLPVFRSEIIDDQKIAAL
jgi:hypothetical protein